MKSARRDRSSRFVKRCSLKEVGEETANDCHISRMIAETVVAETGFATVSQNYDNIMAMNSGSCDVPADAPVADWIVKQYAPAFDPTLDQATFLPSRKD